MMIEYNSSVTCQLLESSKPYSKVAIKSSKNIKSDLKCSGLALSWITYFNKSISSDSAQSSIKIFSNIFSPVSFFNSLITLAKTAQLNISILSSKNRGASSSLEIVRSQVQGIRDASFACSSSVGFVRLCDALSGKKIQSDKNLAGRVNLASSISSVVGGIASLVCSAFSLNEISIAFKKCSIRKKEVLYARRKDEVCNIISGVSSLAVSTLSFAGRVATIPLSPLVFLSFQTVSAFISLRKKIIFSY